MAHGDIGAVAQQHIDPDALPVAEPVAGTLHLDQARTQLERKPRERPRMLLDPSVKSIFDFRYEHFQLENYDPHPHIAAPVAV